LTRPDAPSAYGWSSDAQLEEIRELIAVWTPDGRWSPEQEQVLIAGIAWLDHTLSEGGDLPSEWQRDGYAPQSRKPIRATSNLPPL
jgi:hypothetical protein